MSDLKTCRFCHMSNYDYDHPAANSAWVRISTRHNVHLKCAVEKQGFEFFDRLPLHKLDHLPFFEIKALGAEEIFRATMKCKGYQFAVLPTAGDVVVIGTKQVSK